ncbi:PQQ-dependent sugar dehydrogenase [Actinoplanes sp. LDG1-06]|uniref:PQQ-dependent sugar dehydrogenase n=1 Tax=Paractinoplanes ovalisporus TaxID=2810368 RepID=A0ABS2A3E6_9ACTN|nr:PQQ-dependent sugar dehydrogenase [Actinoplanes ovalisporus]MBM2614373.1 PQQ-dependent sugar dehydrogenase [Actinoplanes ovalisporus]
MRALPALITALALAAGTAACSAAAEDTPDGSGDTPAAPNSSSGSGSGAGGVQQIATGIDVPWGLAFRPGGDALVAERDSGRILRLAPGGQPEPVYEVPGVAAQGEGGLLGLAVNDDWVYAYFTAADDNRIVRFRLTGNAEPEVIFDGIAKAGNHNGGRIAFGPDGMLYVGTGDAGDTGTSQNASSPNGKILRLTPDGDPAPGNPTAGSPVYSLGHRNVQGLAWDDRDRLFATEFGQNDLDEINLIEPGKNYGWPDVEGEGDTDGGRFTNPLVTWSTSEASPSGLAISGNTLYAAALRGERLWTVPIEGDGLGEPRALLEGEYGRIRTAEVAPDGSLWVTTSNTDGRGDVRDGDDRILRLTPDE